ncbi:MAG: hypothetical protein KGP10_04660 [Actinomycetales bacterium]|nr:hypothetical protein [Actinomycetales bacterium]
MKMTVKLPRLGDTVDEVHVLEWLKQPGDVVAVGDPLMSVETDKATVDVPSPVAGTLAECLVTAGQDIATGDPVAVLDAD